VSVADPCWGDDGDAAWLRRNLLLSMLLLLVLPLFIVSVFQKCEGKLNQKVIYGNDNVVARTARITLGEIVARFGIVSFPQMSSIRQINVERKTKSPLFVIDKSPFIDKSSLLIDK
jgi:hypothetical protein